MSDETLGWIITAFIFAGAVWAAYRVGRKSTIDEPLTDKERKDWKDGQR
jgi:hypothetical protein